MKKLLFLPLVLCVSVCFAQTFPGVNAAQRKQLLSAGLKIPLPTYLPPGFLIDSVIVETGKELKAWDKTLFARYSKKINDSTYQSFFIRAGFDGLGSLWYDSEKIPSAVGNIHLYYQPYDEDGPNRQRVEDLVGTEWFSVGGTEFHVYCYTPHRKLEEDEIIEEEFRDPRNYKIISRSEFKKILQSLKVLK